MVQTIASASISLDVSDLKTFQPPNLQLGSAGKEGKMMIVIGLNDAAENEELSEVNVNIYCDDEK